MDFDNSWEALLNPGEATVYFDRHQDAGFQPFQADATTYSKINAWWLAELCRLVYKQGPDEPRTSVGPPRAKVLNDVGLKEVRFFNNHGTQCNLVRTANPAAAQYAALIFRGSTEGLDWLTNFTAIPVHEPGRGFVHLGFRDALDRVWKDVQPELDKLDCPVFYAGHSLGAALATVAASRRPPRALYTFGSPRVGDNDFKATLKGKQVYRVVNNLDLVTTVPPPAPFHHLNELHYVTHAGAMLVNPSDATVLLDRLKRDQRTLISGSILRPQINPDPIEPLADHAAVNYVAHLERLV